MIEYADPRRVALDGTWSASMARWIAARIGWAFSGVLVLGAVVAVAMLALQSSTMSGLAGIMAILTIVVAGRSLRAARQARAGMVLAYIEQAVRLNQPLPEM